MSTNLSTIHQTTKSTMPHRVDFQIAFPLRNRIVRDLKIVTDYKGDLIVEGTAYLHQNDNGIYYSADIDFVRWKGADIKEVLEVTGGMEEIEEFVIVKANLFFEQIKAA